MTQPNKCKDCKFYSEAERTVLVPDWAAPGNPLRFTVTDITCWRHPEHVKVSEDHWCGDYTANDKGE
jgi:hypothetical protein